MGLTTDTASGPNPLIYRCLYVRTLRLTEWRSRARGLNFGVCFHLCLIFYTLCMRAIKALERLCTYTGSSEPWLFTGKLCELPGSDVNVEGKSRPWMRSKVLSVDVLKFQTLLACQKCLDKQCRPRSDCFCRSSLIRVLSVCYIKKHFVTSNPENQHFLVSEKCSNFLNIHYTSLIHMA